MFYPALLDYIKPENASLMADIFSEIASLSDDIFSDYDSEMIIDLGENFYFDNYKKPLKTIYFHRFHDLESNNQTISDLLKHVAEVAYKRFGANWESIYNAYFATEYEPLENYSMTQTRTPLLDTTNTTTRKQNTQVVTSGDTSIVPYNSDTPTLTGTSNGESTTTEAKDANEIETQINERGTDTLTRHGNIGVTTSQQMLQSEIDLRRLDFQKLIFNDIEKIMFRDYWPAC